MVIIQFVVGLFLGWVAGSLTIIPLTVLRFGIPMCNTLIKNGEEVKASKLLRKKYCISLIIWIPIILLIDFICYRFLNIGIYTYFLSWAFMILIGYGSTGKTKNNLIEFNNSLRNCIDILNDKS